MADAARVMGSRRKLQRVLDGTDPVEVVNRGVPQRYRTVRLGENLSMPHPEAVPRADEAVIPDAKLTAYALNPAHDVGGHKARLFASALGITAENRHLLTDAIRSGLPLVPARSGIVDEHGARFRADIEVTGPKGRATVRTGWIVREPGGVPHLTTAIVWRRKR